MRDDVKGLLTICRRAHKAEMGLAPAKEAIKSGAARLILITSDASPKTAKEARFFAGKENVPVLDAGFAAEEAEYCTGSRAVVIAITDSGFAKRFKELLDKPDNINK